MTAAVARVDIELRMAEQLVDCAHSLALSFGDAAQAETDFERRLRLYDAFHRSFQAVRLGIRLALTLRSDRAQPVAAPAAVETEAAEPDEVERPEREPLDARMPRERGDREADYEPVSLTKFLATLRGVAADAERLPVDADPAVLPKLQTLLAQAEPQARDADVAVKVRPPPPSPQRSRLLGSTARPLDLSAFGRPRPPPRPSG